MVVLFHDVSAPTAAGLFSVSNLLQGRVDVWCRCVTAALYLSDDLRRDTVVSLVLSPPSSEEKHEKEFPTHHNNGRTRVVSVRGDEVEGLAPAETRVALLLQRATQHASLGALGELGREAKAAAKTRAANRDEDEKKSACEKKSARNARLRRNRWVAQRPGSAGPVPGITVTDYLNLETCLNAVCDASHILGGGPGSILLLDAAGAPFPTRRKTLGKEKRASADASAKTTFVLGDATGITKIERELLMRQDGISTVALGPRVLLASHCIVLAHAALDNIE